MPEHALELPTAWGGLGGTLLQPEGAGPVPAVLLIPGAGPTDRDGNHPLLPEPCDNLKLMAQALAARGIASLRYDKRGVGASRYPGLQEAALRFDHMVDDALTCAARLRQDPRFTRLVLVGHSEGSLVAALAAAGAQADAVACVSAAGMPAGALMRAQVARVLPPGLAGPAQQALQSLEAQQPVEHVPDELFLLLRPTLQPYLMSWFRHDPARILAELAVPVLLVHGAADSHVPVEQVRLLHAARPDARLLVVDGMDHLLALHGDVARGTAAVAAELHAWLAQPRLATAG